MNRVLLIAMSTLFLSGSVYAASRPLSKAAEAFLARRQALSQLSSDEAAPKQATPSAVNSAISPSQNSAPEPPSTSDDERLARQLSEQLNRTPAEDDPSDVPAPAPAQVGAMGYGDLVPVSSCGSPPSGSDSRESRASLHIRFSLSPGVPRHEHLWPYILIWLGDLAEVLTVPCQDGAIRRVSTLFSLAAAWCEYQLRPSLGPDKLYNTFYRLPERIRHVSNADDIGRFVATMSASQRSKLMALRNRELIWLVLHGAIVLYYLTRNNGNGMFPREVGFVLMLESFFRHRNIRYATHELINGARNRAEVVRDRFAALSAKKTTSKKATSKEDPDQIV